MKIIKLFRVLKILKITILSILTINLFLILYGYNLFVKSPLIIKDEIGFKEKYKKEYFTNIQSMNELNKYFNSEAKRQKISSNDYRYIDLASEIVKNRFYYNGYSYYSAEDNLILFLLGKYVWDDFDAIVAPDDILKKEHAACSQQSIILMELFKRNGFSVRKIGLNKHFALEAKFNGDWYFFDPTFEPNFHLKRESLNFLLKDKKLLYSSYRHVMTKKQVDRIFSKIKYGKINKFPAPRMILFHKVSFFYINHLILITFLFFVLYYFLNKKLKASK